MTVIRAPVEHVGPTLSGCWIRTTHDALVLFRAVEEGHLRAVPRRLSDLEKVTLIRSGNVFVWEEKSSGIKRWTDAREWSPSRILHNFLIYRELNPNRPDRTSKGTSHGPGSSQSSPSAAARAGRSDRRASTEQSDCDDTLRELVGSLRESDDFQIGGLMKKTITITFNHGTPNERAHHIVSYYTPEDVLADRLLPVGRHPLIQGMEPGDRWLDPTHFRFPPRIRYDDYGYRHYVGEADDEPVPPAPTAPSLRALARPRGIGGSTNNNGQQPAGRSPRNRGAPYIRPILTTQNSSSSISTAATDGSTSSTTDASPMPRSASTPGVNTTTHMPSLSPSSTSSSLSGSSPEYVAAQPANTLAAAGYYNPYAAYGGTNSIGPDLSSLPAVDHSATPRPSPYYPAAFWQQEPSAMMHPHAAAYMRGYDYPPPMYAAHHYAHPYAHGAHAQAYAYAAQYDAYYGAGAAAAHLAGPSYKTEDDMLSPTDGTDELAE